MAIRSVSNIRISGKGTSGEAGKAFGGFITNFNFDLGYSESPSSMSVTIDTLDSDYIDMANLISYIDSYDVTIGNSIKFKMYLVEYEEVKGPEKSSLNLSFVDGSHILDRIYIGLLGEHDYSDNSRTTTEIQASIPVVCKPCSSRDNIANDITVTVPDDFSGQGDYYNYITSRGKFDQSFFPLYKSDNDTGFFPNKASIYKDGGVIIIGEEEMGDSDCAIKPTTYTFKQLRDKLKQLTPIIDLKIRTNSALEDSINNYRRDYTGTLREVLGNWCSDFGVTFMYNPFETNFAEIIEIDGTDQLINKKITKIKTEAESITGTAKTDAVVEEVSFKGSKQESAKKFLVGKYKKDPSTDEGFGENTLFYRTIYGAFPVESLYPDFSRLGRSLGDFVRSCTLAKFSPELRTIFNLFRGIQTGNTGYFRALGFSTSGGLNIDGDLKRQVINTLNREEFLRISQLWDSTGNSNVFMAVGFYSEALANQELEFEKRVAETFGKYFFSNINTEKKQPICPDFFSPDYIKFEPKLSPECKTLYHPLSTTQVQAAGNMSAQNGIFSLPFANALRQPVPLSSLFTTGRDTLNIHERSDSTFGVTEDFVKSFLQKINDNGQLSNESLLQFLLPRFLKVEGVLANTLKSRFNAYSIKTAIVNGEQQRLEPKLIIGPSLTTMARHVSIQDLSIGVNLLDGGAVKKNPPDPDTCEGKGNFICNEQRDLANAVCRTVCEDELKGGGTVPAQNDPFYQIFQASAQGPFSEGIIPYNIAFNASSPNGEAIDTISQLPAGPTNTKYSSPVFQVQFQPYIDLSSSSAVINAVNSSPRFFKIPLPLGTKINTSGDSINPIFAANYIETLDRKIFKSKLQIIKNTFKGMKVGDVSKIHVDLQDLSDLQSLSEEGADQNQILKIFTHNNSQFTTIDDYYQFLTNLNFLNDKSVLPRSELKIKLAGLELGSLEKFIKVSDGLSSYNISLSNDGYTTSLVFQNRPDEMPVKEMFMNYIGPNIKRT